MHQLIKHLICLPKHLFLSSVLLFFFELLSFVNDIAFEHEYKILLSIYLTFNMLAFFNLQVEILIDTTMYNVVGSVPGENKDLLVLLVHGI